MATITAPKRARTLCGIALPEPEATALAARNLADYRDAGCRVRVGWDTRAPYISGESLHFLDHHYRITCPDRTKVYAVEPYGVESDDLIELARLCDAGWEVSIGQFPLWYPGRTTPILMRREAVTSARRESRVLG